MMFWTGPYLYIILMIICVIVSVQSRGPHHPRGEPVARKNHVHYRPDPSSGQKLTQDDALLHDKQHIEEHLEDMVDTPDLSKMSDEELEFYYFQTHDSDKNNKLDGLEILQAISHIIDENEMDPDSDPKNENDVNIEYYIKLIDQVLDEDDVDQDGYLNYSEYVRSRSKSTKNAKIKKGGNTPVVEMIP